MCRVSCVCLSYLFTSSLIFEFISEKARVMVNRLTSVSRFVCHHTSLASCCNWRLANRKEGSSLVGCMLNREVDERNSSTGGLWKRTGTSRAKKIKLPQAEKGGKFSMGGEIYRLLF